jgi:hypothetical protein
MVMVAAAVVVMAVTMVVVMVGMVVIVRVVSHQPPLCLTQARRDQRDNE